MAASLQFTTYVSGDQRVIEAVVTPGSDIPAEIFLFENTGNGPGAFFGVCSFDDFSKFPADTGQPMSTFGRKYIRGAMARQFLPLDVDPTLVTSNLQLAASNFRVEYLNQTGPKVTTVSI